MRLLVHLVCTLQTREVSDLELHPLLDLGIGRVQNAPLQIGAIEVPEVERDLDGHALPANLDGHVGNELRCNFGHAMFIR